MESVFALLTLVIVFCCNIFAIDDLFIDAVALFKKLKPRLLTDANWLLIKSQPEKKIAILVANWKEHEILPAMVRGNIQEIKYSNYTIFLGVYPNDEGTWATARRLEQLYPEKVVVIVNSFEGPTSKGQLLNEMVSKILNSELTTQNRYDLFLMHDSEDIIHPDSLSIVSYYSDQADFTQMPVFSFNRPWTHFVGGTYIDEFSESHTKDLLVRQHLKAAIPSAGVGTAISRRLMKTLLEFHGTFLKEDTLTEDYHLGLMTKELGFKSQFLCFQKINSRGKKEFVATREFFPNVMKASIRQKSRWTLGIVFQGAQNWDWQGGIEDRYFLFRDRRGPINGILILSSFFILLGMLGHRLITGYYPDFATTHVMWMLFLLPTVNMLVRTIQRMRAVYLTTTLKQAVCVPLRWPLGNLINSWASLSAYQQFKKYQKLGERPVWIKTEHELPAKFGKEVQVEELSL